MREERITLKNYPNMSLVGRDARESTTIEIDLPGCGSFKSGD
jgi:hypothetical protein